MAASWNGTKNRPTIVYIFQYGDIKDYISKTSGHRSSARDLTTQSNRQICKSFERQPHNDSCNIFNRHIYIWIPNVHCEYFGLNHLMDGIFSIDFTLIKLMGIFLRVFNFFPHLDDGFSFETPISLDLKRKFIRAIVEMVVSTSIVQILIQCINIDLGLSESRGTMWTQKLLKNINPGNGHLTIYRCAKGTNCVVDTWIENEIRWPKSSIYGFFFDTTVTRVSAWEDRTHSVSKKIDSLWLIF